MTSRIICLIHFLKFYRVISLSSWDCTLFILQNLKLRLKLRDNLLVPLGKCNFLSKITWGKNVPFQWEYQ